MLNTGEQAIEWVTWLSAILIVMDSAEKAATYKSYSAEGLLSWAFLRTSHYFASKPAWVRYAADYVYSAQVWTILLVLRGLCGVCLLLLPLYGLATISCLFIIFVVTSLINFWRQPFSAETYNRLMVVIMGALLLRSLMPDTLVTTACLWFIALQSCFSYCTAGFAKIFNVGWRTGYGLYNIFTGANWYSSKKVSLFIIRHQLAGRILTWFTIVMECSFPLALLLPKPYFLFYLFWGVAFHVFNAVFLNLGKFMIAWIATYPAIIFVAQQ